MWCIAIYSVQGWHFKGSVTPCFEFESLKITFCFVGKGIWDLKFAVLDLLNLKPSAIPAFYPNNVGTTNFYFSTMHENGVPCHGCMDIVATFSLLITVHMWLNISKGISCQKTGFWVMGMQSQNIVPKSTLRFHLF